MEVSTFRGVQLLWDSGTSLAKTTRSRSENMKSLGLAPSKGLLDESSVHHGLEEMGGGLSLQGGVKKWAGQSTTKEKLAPDFQGAKRGR